HRLHVVLQTALYYQGGLDAAERLAGVAAAGGGPVTAAVAQVHKVNVLRARGDLAAARRVLEAAPTSIRSSRFVEFWLHAEAELVMEEGDGERALELIRDARSASRRHRWRVRDRASLGGRGGSGAGAAGADVRGRRAPGVGAGRVRRARPRGLRRVGGRVARRRAPDRGPGA